MKLPFTILAPVIFVLCVVGGYAPTQDMHDVWLMLIFGVSGYLMRKLDYPMAPMVLAIVLGPLVEPSLRQALMLSEGSLMVFIMRPISGPIMGVALLFLLPVIKAVNCRLGAGNASEGWLDSMDLAASNMPVTVIIMNNGGIYRGDEASPEQRVSCMVYNPNSHCDKMMFALGGVLKQRKAEC